MTPVNLRLPPGAEVYNFLYRSTDPEYHVQDVLAVHLPNGICIDAGWLPEHDPNGRYQLQVFIDAPNHALGQPLFLANIDQLIQAVEFLSWHYSRKISATSYSRSNDISVSLVA